MIEKHRLLSTNLCTFLSTALPLAIAAIFLFFTSPSASAQQESNVGTAAFQSSEKRVKDFYEKYGQRLNSVMRTRLEEEQEFIDQVVVLVREGKLPKNVVDRAWLWVNSKRGGSPYPFVYFEQVLRLQAKKLKLEVPEFDRSIYSQARRNTTSRRRR